MIRSVLIALSLCLICAPSVAQAQTRDTVTKSASFIRDAAQWERSMEISGRHHKEHLAELKAGRGDRGIHARALLHVYPFTRWFTPFGADVNERLTRHAFTIDTSEDIAEVNDAIIEYRALLDQHLGNLDVLNHAIDLSRIDARMGDPILLKAIRDEIIDSLDNLGLDGLSPSQAYPVKTLGEESYLLAKLGADIQKSELYDTRLNYYNVHDVVLPDGRFQQIYVDVTTPLRNAQILQTIRERSRALQ